MRKMMWKVWGFLQAVKNRDEGQGMVEYGLIIALIAVVVVAALIILGPKIRDMFTGVTNSMNITNGS